MTVALGHSNATFEEAKKAVDAGASVWVHAYNGMRGCLLYTSPSPRD